MNIIQSFQTSVFGNTGTVTSPFGIMICQMPFISSQISNTYICLNMGIFLKFSGGPARLPSFLLLPFWGEASAVRDGYNLIRLMDAEVGGFLTIVPPLASQFPEFTNCCG